MQRDPIWIELAVYATVFVVFISAYILIMKYGIPWYYCTYHFVCF